MRGAALVAVVLVGLVGCAAPSSDPTATPSSEPGVSDSADAAPGDGLGIACTEFPEAYLDLQSIAIGSEVFAEVAVQSGLTRLALEAAAETTLSGAEFEPFVTEQVAFLDTVDAAALAEDRIALLTAIQEGPSFIEPLADTCAGQPGW